MNERKTKVFKFLLVLFPFTILLFVEIVLRIFGLFQEEPLFLEKLQYGEKVYQLNPYVAKRYFDPAKITIPTLYPEIFTKSKSDNTYRIFCLGGSTMAGFPFDYQVPFPLQLKYLLRAAYPNYHFEVINFGLSAINSFSIVDLLPEILDKQPDLILIYMGHNEFYGAYGSASTFSLGQNGDWIRFYLQFKKSRIVQLIKRTLLWLAKENKKNPKEINLMEQVIADKSVIYHSQKYTNTLKNFEENLQIILKGCKTKNVPVILSNLVSNVKDLEPFSSPFSDKLFPDQILELEENLAWGDSLYRQRLYRESLSCYKTAYSMDTTAAINWYKMGRVLSALEDSTESWRFLNGAKDRDAVRFRASEDLNRIISREIKAYNVNQVNMVQIFRNHSAQGLVGSNLICDHLHPNPEGYYLMAKGFFEVINERNLLEGGNSAFVPQSKPYHVTDLDWNIGLIKIFKMINRWPFPEKKIDYEDFSPYGDQKAAAVAFDYLFHHQNWGRAHYEMADFYLTNDRFEKAREEYLAVQMYFDTDADPLIQIARIYKSQEKWDLCETYYKKALALKTGSGMILYQIGIAQWKQKKLSDAIQNMQKATFAPDLNLDQKLNAKYYLAGFLAEDGKFENAMILLKEMIRLYPKFRPAYQLLYQLEQEKKN